jgi:hypothetical protein
VSASDGPPDGDFEGPAEPPLGGPSEFGSDGDDGEADEPGTLPALMTSVARRLVSGSSATILRQTCLAAGSHTRWFGSAGSTWLGIVRNWILLSPMSRNS